METFKYEFKLDDNLLFSENLQLTKLLKSGMRLIFLYIFSSFSNHATILIRCSLNVLAARRRVRVSGVPCIPLP